MNPHASEAHLTALRVLIVEDNEDDATLILDLLRRQGYSPSPLRVETESALRHAMENERWDIVITDYCLPSFDAPGAIRTIREVAPEVPVIVISGTVGEDLAVETLQLGADDYLLKQNLTRFEPAVRRALETAASRRATRTLERMKGLILENSVDIICTMDVEGRFLEVSAASLPVLGYEPSELVGRLFLDFIHPDDILCTAEIAAQVVDGRPTRDFENRYIHKSGHVIDLMWSAVWASSEQIVICIGRDITERKKEQEDLRVALERLRLSVRAARIGTWNYDLTTGQIDWDEQMYILYGKDPSTAEPGPERWFSAIHPDDQAHTRKIHEDAIAGAGDGFETEFRILRADDGSKRVIRAMGVLLRNAANEAVRLTGINWDVTEERTRERNLARALAKERELSEKARAGELAKSEFLAVMSHEVRTPLNGILGFADLLTREPDLSAECRAYTETIVLSGEALLHILDDILEFSRLEAGQAPIETADFEPARLLEDIRRLLAPQAAEKGIAIECCAEPTVPRLLHGDAGRLRQILLNLAGNALKFSDHGTVTLSLGVDSEEEGRYRFQVSDEGPGIPHEKQETIFQPFTQADSSISRKHGGTGLGLAIARRLSLLLGGTLSVESQPGKGACFTLSLPLGGASQEAVCAPPPRRAPLSPDFAHAHPLKILLVEDDKINLRLIETLIRRLGYKPISARNGREAIEKYQAEIPDCILMDVQMPEMDGIEATMAIRHFELTSLRPRRTFISALTADIFPADRERCIRAGMNDYLNKPVTIEGLSRVLVRASEAAAEGTTA